MESDGKTQSLMKEPKWDKKREKKSLAGRGFGGAQAKLGKEEKLEALRVRALDEDGFVYIKVGGVAAHLPPRPHPDPGSRHSRRQR